MTTPTTTPTSTTPPGGTPPTTETKPTTPPPVEPKKQETTPPPTEPKKQETKPEEQDLLTGDDEPTETDGSQPKGGEIELTVPDGIEVDTKLMDGFKGVAKSLNLDSKGAQKILDLYVENVQNAEKQIVSNWNTQKAQWRDTVAKDKEIGGASMKENLTLAKATINKVGGPALMQALRDLDIGSHPEIVRAFVRVGKLLSDDSLADLGGGGGGGGGNNRDSDLDEFFPSMKNEKRT